MLLIGQRCVSADFQSERKSDLLGGLLVLHQAEISYKYEKDAENALNPHHTGGADKTKKLPLTSIPYYAWANMQATSMQVGTPLVGSYIRGTTGESQSLSARSL